MEYYRLRFFSNLPLASMTILGGNTMLRSPEAPLLLHELSLSEAFHKYVLNDPEVVPLAEAAMRTRQDYESTFREGKFPGDIVKFAWPLDITASDLACQFVSSILLNSNGSEPDAPPAVKTVSVVIVDRLKALRDLLTFGRVIARGTFSKTGEIKTVGRLEWARRDVLIDVQNSDLLDIENGKSFVKWSGLSLEAAVGQLEALPKSTEATVETPSKKKRLRRNVQVSMRPLRPTGPTAFRGKFPSKSAIKRSTNGNEIKALP